MSLAQQVLDADARRRQALLQADARGLSEALHDDFQQVHATGVVEVKESLLAKIDSGTLIYKAIDVRETTVDILSTDTALQVSEILQSVVIAGTPKPLHVRVVSVWVRVGACWLLRSYQGTAIAAPALPR